MAEEGFLGRWSRRKREATGRVGPEEPPPRAAEEPAEAAAEAVTPAPADARPAADEEAGAAEAAPHDGAFDPASLPPLDSLTAESDLTAFLRPQVPAALRSAALRRLWSLDPAIRDYVGPADYAWDYNAPDGVPGFALDLGADAKRLLAQAIGALETPEDWPAAEPAPDATHADEPGALPSAAEAPSVLPSDVMAAAGDDDASPSSPSAPPATVHAPPAEDQFAPRATADAPDAGRAPASAILPPASPPLRPPPVRRHGGARPA